eukprot:TRINITY_DN745_c0_g2_i1.p1 TRINITY_DN745_c0_g2~~TRINITY_DN745_c0_g2_i1.p1  ORF type:complete len:325 (+),score=23.50 TRINITY_DN745_c0_g2_i1:47-1021(+)
MILDETPLQHAVKKQNLSIMKMLLQAGANPNSTEASIRCSFEKEPLRLAVDDYCKNPDANIAIIDTLLNYKADPTMALMDSIMNDSLEMTGYLLGKGASLSANPGVTARLVGAAASKVIEGADLSIIKLLLDAGATVGFLNRSYSNAYYSCFRCKYSDRIPEGSAMYLAIKTRSLNLLELLLRYGGREALNESVIGHHVFKARCPVDNQGRDIFKAIGATEISGGYFSSDYLSFECQNSELNQALAYCMGTRDYYCDGCFYDSDEDYDYEHFYESKYFEKNYLYDLCSHDDICVDKHGYIKGRVKGPKRSRTRTSPDQGYDLYS